METASFIKFNISFIVLIFIFLSCDGPCVDGVKSRTFPESMWTANLNQFVPMASVRLNNYTPTAGEFCSTSSIPLECQNSQNSMPEAFCAGQEFQFKHPCDSHINFGIGQRIFDITVPRLGPDNMLRAYINDINSNRIINSIVNGMINIQIQFESRDREIIGACHNNFFCFAGTPDFELNNMVINISFVLAVRRGQITYTNVTVDLDADFQNAGICRDNLFAVLCGDRRGLIFDTIEREFTRNLLSPETNRSVSLLLHSSIISATFLGDIFISDISIDEENNLLVEIPCS